MLAAATDDAWLVERDGGTVRVVAAPPENLKITTPGDLQVAELALRARARCRSIRPRMNLSRARRASAFTIACAATAATAGIAFGQAPAAPSGNYGGGAIGLPVSEKTVAKDMLLSVRASGGKVGVDGQLYASCGLGTISGDAHARAPTAASRCAATSRASLWSACATRRRSSCAAS